MVRASRPTDASLPSGFEVERVTDGIDFDDHVRAAGGDPPITATWKRDGLLRDSRWMLFVGRAAGRRVGCTLGTLQASAIARRMYEALGFRSLFLYRAFRG